MALGSVIRRTRKTAKLQSTMTSSDVARNSDATIYVVDDDPGARASVTALAESHGVAVRSFPSAEAFLEYIGQVEEPRGCVVADVRMKGMSGLELQQHAKIDLPIIIITAYADIPMAVQAIQNGAVDFLTKPCEPERLWTTITRALTQDRAARHAHRDEEVLRGRLAALTGAERAVLEKVMHGLPNKQIARDLDIGLRTVELRRSNIMKKMKADSLAELIQLALAAGFKTDGPHVATDKPEN